MSVERCELTEMIVSECSHCTGRLGHEALGEKVVRASRTIEADFAGGCAHCGKRYDAGARIVMSHEVGGWCLEDHTVFPGFGRTGMATGREDGPVVVDHD